MSLFEPAKRRSVKARIALTGVSGSGKTLSSLYLAYGLAGDWSKVALIDTEHERALFYANRDDLDTGKFLYAPMHPPYEPAKYKQYAAEAAATVGEDGVVIIDSFSHAWNAEGGILDLKEKISERPGKNSYTAWHEAGKEQLSLVNHILSLPCHTILTMRSKMDYAMEVNDKGKQQPVKVGLAPIQRDDTEYEFDIVLDIARNHIASVSKDTTYLGDWCDVITPIVGLSLRTWLESGEAMPKCEICGKVIKPYKKLGVSDIIEKSKELMGKQACVECSREWKKQNEAAKTVSA